MIATLNQLFNENIYYDIKFWGGSIAMDGKRLTGSGTRHVVVLEVIGYVYEYDLIAHWINDIFYNNAKAVEDGSSIANSIEKFTRKCNKNIIQHIETVFDKYLFENGSIFRLNGYKLIPDDQMRNDNGSTTSTTVMSIHSDTSNANESESEEKRDIESDDWETKQTPGNGQSSEIKLQLCLLCLYSYLLV